MHKTWKGRQEYFGMRARIGVDSRSGIVHSVGTTAAVLVDKHMRADLPHGDERKVSVDVRYQGQRAVIHEATPHARGMTSRRTR